MVSSRYPLGWILKLNSKINVLGRSKLSTSVSSLISFIPGKWIGSGVWIYFSDLTHLQKKDSMNRDNPNLNGPPISAGQGLCGFNREWSLVVKSRVKSLATHFWRNKIDEKLDAETRLRLYFLYHIGYMRLKNRSKKYAFGIGKFSIRTFRMTPSRVLWEPAIISVCPPMKNFMFSNKAGSSSMLVSKSFSSFDQHSIILFEDLSNLNVIFLNFIFEFVFENIKSVAEFWSQLKS